MPNTYTHTVILTNPTTQNPFTVASNGAVLAPTGNGILGTAGYPWTLTNYGTISTTATNGTGVDLTDGGSVQNAGLIQGYTGIDIAGSGGGVSNSGTIASTATASGGGGIVLYAGGLVTNGTRGSSDDLISGLGSNAVSIRDTTGTVVNFGTIASLLYHAVFMTDGGAIFNYGTITDDNTAHAAVSFHNDPGTVANYGLIQAGGYDGVRLQYGGDVTNAVDSRIVGGGNGVYLIDSSGTVNNFGTISGSGTGDAGVNLAAGGAVINYGIMISSAGVGVALQGAATLTNGGTIAGAATAVSFGSGTELLVIEAAGVFGGALSGLDVNDTIDLTAVEANNASYNNGILLLSDSGTVVSRLTASTATDGLYFHLRSDGRGGTDITVSRYAGTYINNRVASGLDLQGIPQNPVTIGLSGYVTNTGTAFAGDAIYGSNSTGWSIDNLGTIKGSIGESADGVQLVVGGTVDNGQSGSSAGLITGNAQGVAIAGAAGHVANYGTVMAAGTAGVYLGSGGGVYNAPNGLISGAANGVSLLGVSIVTNSGTIAGGSGIVAGSSGATTITNAGTIVGTAGTAVALGGGSDRLVLYAGAVEQGVLYGGGGASVLEIAAGAGGGALSALHGLAAATGLGVNPGTVENFTALQVDPSATETVSAGQSFATLVNQGQINIAAYYALAIGYAASAATPGVIDLMALDATIIFSGAVADQTVEFQPPGGTAVLDDPAAFAGSLTQFAPGDTIALPGTISGVQYSSTDDVLSLVSGGTTIDLDVSVASTVTNPLFEAISASGGTDITVTQGPSPPPSAAEVFWTDSTTGDTGYWAFNGSGDVAGFDDLGAGSLSYTPVGSGDFDGGGSEVLWEDAASGNTGYWVVANGTVGGFGELGSADTAYSIVGVGDFDGSGHDEVLWEDAATGNTGFWTTSGGTVTGFDALGSADTAYSIAGVGDFDGSGHEEVLWEDIATGAIGYWTTSNGVVTGFDALGSANTAYSVVGIGDFDASGHDEVLWEDKTTGDIGYWTLSNGVVTGFANFGFADTAYSVVGTGDYDGAGHAEVLFENTATGDTGYWTTNGSQVTGFHDLGAASTAYHVIPLDTS